MRVIIVLVLLMAWNSSAGQAGLGDKVCVTGDYFETGLKLHEKPDESSPVVIVIGPGRMAIEFERRDGWIWVGVDRTAGRQGWAPEAAFSFEDLDGLPCGS